MIFYPTAALDTISDITPAFLSGLAVTALMIDVDNTLTTHGHPVPSDGVLEWLDSLRAHGISMVVLSNNFEKRVRPFAESLGLAYVANARKPLPVGMRRAQRLLRAPKEQTAIVGDQIFTDVAGGNLFGIKTILLPPLEMEKGFLFLCKRVIERPVLKRVMDGKNQK